MNDKHPEAVIEFDARETPISTRFDDPYFSFENGLAESEYVFLAGNDLPARFAPSFHVAELGFGTGLNFLLTWQAWREAGLRGELSFTSFEAYPMGYDDRARALAHFPQIAEFAEQFRAEFDGANFEAEGVRLMVVLGDARETLRRSELRADAWYLDGFSPAKNPELWDGALMRAVYEHTAKGGTFATYSAAGFVRRNLMAAGFDVERLKGYGAKRHMLKGRKI